MNDETTFTNDQLLAATAPRTSHQPAAGEALDPSVAVLREGFLAFGQAVERGAADFDEAGLIARLQAECMDRPAPAASSRALPRRRTWLPALAGALAASALVVALGIRIATTWPTADNVVAVPSPSNNAPAPQQPAIAQNHEPSSPEPRPAFGVTTWDDPLDDEILAAQSRLAGLYGQPALDRTLTSLSNDLDTMSSDLKGGSL